MAPPEERRANWLFVDMNSFFASVEQHLRPELRGRTVGVVPVAAEGSCIIAASADAKQLGVRVGMRVREARQLCPRITLVKARPAIYVDVHHALFRTIESCTPIEKTYSIDEWAVRLRGTARRVDSAVALGRCIKQRMRAEFSPWLTCSIGIAPTRLLAKIASDLKKPDGLTTLDPADLPQRLEHLKLDDLPGIAGGMRHRLHAAGIRTIRQLWELSRAESRQAWGSVQGETWWSAFHGHDQPEAATRRRTMTHANMLAPEFRDDAGAHGILLRLLCKGAARLRHYRYGADRLLVSVRSYNGRTWHADSALPGTQDTLTIVRQFEELWRKRPWRPGGGAESDWRPFAQVAMTLAGLTPLHNLTGHLFPQEERLRNLSLTIDSLNRRWGRNAVYLGSLHEFRHEMEDKIAFGRIPDRAVPI